MTSNFYLQEKKMIIHREENFIELPNDLLYQEMIFLIYLKYMPIDCQAVHHEQNCRELPTNVFYQKFAIF
jgi:hypothetical protein